MAFPVKSSNKKATFFKTKKSETAIQTFSLKKGKLKAFFNNAYEIQASFFLGKAIFYKKKVYSENLPLFQLFKLLSWSDISKKH